MKPETEAKAIIALIISLIAFGCGSGAGIVMGLSQNDALNTTKINNTSEAQEFPQIQTTKNVNTPAKPQTTTDQDNTNSESVYIENREPSGNSTTQKPDDNNNTTE
jgi:hypothetical protein